MILKIKQFEDSDLDRQFRQIIDTLNNGPSWIAPTFTNSWVNYGGSQQTVGYFKDIFGIVYLRGMMKDGTANATAFTLPSGYRPTLEESFGVVGSGGADRVIVQADGVVKCVGTGGAGSYMSLAGITFRTY